MNKEMLTPEEMKKIKEFAIKVNNFLMTISVKGDNVFITAELMIEAGKIYKRLNDE
jgi:hypothetical protein